MLTRLLDWCFSSDSPSVVSVREFVRRHEVTRVGASALLKIVRGTSHYLRLGLQYSIAFLRYLRFAIIHPRAALALFRAWLFPVFTRRERAVMRARAVGGSLSISELGDLWTPGRRSRRILCVAAEPEFRQMEALLRAARRGADIKWLDLQKGLEREVIQKANRVDLIVIAGDFEIDPSIYQMKPHPLVLRLGRLTPLSAWGYRADAAISRNSGGMGLAPTLAEKLRQGEPINVLLLNDVGFQYGAGIALRRQAASFLLNGWNVRLAAWTPGNDTGMPLVTGISDFDHWEGVVPLTKVTARKRDGLDAVEAITGQLDEWKPDVIVAGNLHGTGLPLEILARLRGSGVLLLAYMHDVFWATGRCAYPGACTMFQTGCKPTCPTPDEYPPLEPVKIPVAWAARNELFTGPNAIPMVANSRWTQEIVRQRYGSAARCEVVHLALDHHLYAPIPKPEARRLLGLPQNIPLMVMGAVNVTEQRKGGPLFRDVHQALANRQDAGVMLFGQSSEGLPSMKSFGLVQDARFMPVILSAADILVNTAVEEAFGQTLLEAASCGLSAVAFNVGGVSDIVVHEQTGLLIDDLAVEPMLAALKSLIDDPSKRGALGRRARARVEDQFTLVHQARAWVDCIQGLC